MHLWNQTVFDNNKFPTRIFFRSHDESYFSLNAQKIMALFSSRSRLHAFKDSYPHMRRDRARAMRILVKFVQLVCTALSSKNKKKKIAKVLQTFQLATHNRNISLNNLMKLLFYFGKIEFSA